MTPTERLNAAMDAAETPHPAWARICEMYEVDASFARELIASGVSLHGAVWLFHTSSVWEGGFGSVEHVRRKLGAHALRSVA